MATKDILMERKKILFHNFSGAERKNDAGIIVNRQGARNFNIIIEDPEEAEQMKADGWDIHQTNPDKDGNFLYRLPIHLRYDKYPPRAVVMVSLSTGRQRSLTEETLDLLDGADIVYVDMLVNPSYWNNGDKHGIKAYLSEGYFNYNVNPLTERYAAMESPEE